MSDVTVVAGNVPEAIERFWVRIEANGAGEGTGKAAMANTVMDFAGMVYRGEMEADDSKGVYGRHRFAAEMAATAAGKPLKDQAERSRAAQESKVRAFADLATAARKNPLAWDAIEWARGACRGQYVAFYAGATATAKAMAKHPKIDAATLRPIVEAAATPKANAAATLLDKIRAMHKSLEAILNDDAGTYDAEVNALHTRFNTPVLDSLSVATAKAVAALEKIAAENAPDPEF